MKLFDIRSRFSQTSSGFPMQHTRVRNEKPFFAHRNARGSIYISNVMFSQYSPTPTSSCTSQKRFRIELVLVCRPNWKKKNFPNLSSWAAAPSKAFCCFSLANPNQIGSNLGLMIETLVGHHQEHCHNSRIGVYSASIVVWPCRSMIFTRVPGTW